MYFNKKTLHNLDRNLYCPSSPVLIQKGEVYKDLVDNKVLLKMIFKNVQDKSIIALFIDIKCYNAFKDYLNEIKSFSYLDFEASKNSTIGDNTSIVLPETTFYVDIHLDKVVYSDGEVWKYELPDIFEPIEKPLDIHALLGDNLIQQLNREAKKAGLWLIAKNQLFETENYWICPCGAANFFDSNKCRDCGANKEWIKEHLKPEILQQLIEAYEIEQREIQRLKEEEEKQRLEEEKKKIVSYKVDIFAFCLFALVSVVFLTILFVFLSR